MDDVITRAEHEEFCRRMEAENQRLEDENNRQNHRIEAVEKTTQLIASLAASVEKLAANMENMAKEQERQGKRLETLESRDGEMWRKAAGYVITTVIGIAVGFVFKQIGI
ncbi:MAG: hypothetical protein HFG14_13500 [Lachnospiraceae bacterium]|jgi:phage-related tail protein|nr:hypothetical protein [Lachnospiraceae bacterium]